MKQKYGTQNRYFIVQWHLTHRCNLTCKHCYIENHTDKDVLVYSDVTRIINDIYSTVTTWGASLRINFTGGDPFLYKDFWKILEYTNHKNIRIGILGNPELLDHSTCNSLEKYGVKTYQLSIDGEKDFHDYLRYKGSFQNTLKAIEILNQHKVNSVVMFSVCKQNKDQLLSVINLVAKNKVKRFDFARIVPVGNAVGLEPISITPTDYRLLLYQVNDLYQKLKNENCSTHFGRKENLWKLFFWEIGKLYSPSTSIVSGCGIGYNSISILPDGTVYACRRLPLEIGKLNGTNFREIFLNSNKLNSYRDTEKIQECNTCPLLCYCRGCRAVAYGASGDYFSPDPQCWRVKE